MWLGKFQSFADMDAVFYRSELVKYRFHARWILVCHAVDVFAESLLLVAPPSIRIRSGWSIMGWDDILLVPCSFDMGYKVTCFEARRIANLQEDYAHVSWACARRLHTMVLVEHCQRCI